MKSTKQQRAALRKENQKWPEELQIVPKSQWNATPWDDSKRIGVWRSRHFLVQVFQESDCCYRLSINRTNQDKHGNWVDGITWDELQSLKEQCGLGDYLAFEVYPPKSSVVNVANLRHLWVVSPRSEKAISELIPWWNKKA